MHRHAKAKFYFLSTSFKSPQNRMFCLYIFPWDFPAQTSFNSRCLSLRNSGANWAFPDPPSHPSTVWSTCQEPLKTSCTFCRLMTRCNDSIPKSNIITYYIILSYLICKLQILQQTFSWPGGEDLDMKFAFWLQPWQNFSSKTTMYSDFCWTKVARMFTQVLMFFCTGIPSFQDTDLNFKIPALHL